MERSLTVLLPVHNAQATLTATVQEILEEVADLTQRFDLVIVDDGSIDATSEVAHDLSCHYPQLRAVRHGSRLGREQAIRTGLAQSEGEIVFVRDENADATAGTIRRLWHSATFADATSAETLGGPTVGGRWSRVSPGHLVLKPGYQMIDRRAWEMPTPASRPSRPNYLGRLKEFAWGE